MYNPSSKYLSYIKRILKYLDRTLSYSIIYSRLEYLEELSTMLIEYSNTNYSRDKHTSKLISSNIFMLFSSLIL